MPTYDYRCTVCGNQFEHFQSMFDELLNSCPRCNSVVRRVISGGAGLIFKGSGFYITDYKNNKNSNNIKTPDSSIKQSANKKPTDSGEKTVKSDSK
ncbi:MAG: zinc ribbon domain-containing protein [Candidatus Marinimicrobia bacterium]|nr:zinc ribbon domain-containing protein [Candidatus Neomarinimicrobiota bacterium]